MERPKLTFSLGTPLRKSSCRGLFINEEVLVKVKKY